MLEGEEKVRVALNWAKFRGVGFRSLLSFHQLVPATAPPPPPPPPSLWSIFGGRELGTFFDRVAIN